MKFQLASLYLLLSVVAFASAQLNPSDYTYYAESTTPCPAGAQVFTGGLEIIDGTPADLAQAELRRDFLLHSNASTPYWLLFNQFEKSNNAPPFDLHWDDVVTVMGTLQQDPSNPHAIPYVMICSIGIQRDQDMVTPVPTNYAPVASESFKALYVLMDFADKENNCDAIAPAGISGKDFLNSLLYTGTYHNGKNIRQLYTEMSNGRLTLENSDIVGPWSFPQFSSSDGCDANYVTWENAARSKATQMGYDLTKYGSIVVVVPQTTNCYWAGRASLSNKCNPTASAYTQPPCAVAVLMCQQFVIGHEIGHNLGMYHSAIDTTNNDMVPDANTYLDWSDLMGNRATWTKLNAVKMLTKGYLEASRVRMISGSQDAGTYTLDSLDMSDAASSSYSVLYFTDNTGSVTKTYYFSYRSSLGYSGSLESKYTLGVDVHYYRSNGAGQSYYVKTLMTGSTFTAPVTGFTFTVMNTDGSRAQLKVSCPTCSNSGTPNPSPITYSWLPGTWTTCSKSCGSGAQTRDVSCIASNTNAAVDASYCTFAGTKPSASQTCNTQPCVTTYTWSTGGWSACTAGTSCGTGVQTRSVVCMSSAGYAVTDGTCSLTVAKPAQVQSCTGTCGGSAAPTITYSWATTAFSACSATCGSGTQSRTVYCKGSDGSAAPDSSCTSSKPVSSQTCTAATACATETNTCGSVNCGVNGNCVTSSTGVKSCACINGYTGTACTTAPSLSNVQAVLNADGTISVTWTTVGSYGTVNVYLNSLAGLPMLVGSGVANTGRFSFNAVSFSPAQGQYYVQLSITATVKSSSASFQLSGCEFMNCGAHGSCTSGVCSCTDGYTGSNCQTAPVNPCANSPCLNGGACHVVGGFATCDCSSALNSAGQQYTGTTCQNPPATTCTRKCNAGYAKADCSGCVCPSNGFWSGSNCQICNLAYYNKCVYGYPNAGCTACVCPIGYTGTYCDSKVTAAIVSNLVLPRSSLETDEALITFKQSFSNDLSKALNISSQRIQVTKVVPAGDSDVEELFNVLFNILSLPQRLFTGTSYEAPAANLVLPDSEDDDSSNSMIVPEQGADPNVLITVPASASDDLSTIATNLATALADPNSPLYLGEVTSQLTYGSSTLSVTDPSAQAPTGPANSDSGSTLGTGALVGLCVAGVALIALAAVGTHVYRKRRNGASASGSSSGSSESSVSKSVSFTTVPQSIVRASSNSSSSSLVVVDDDNADDHVLEIQQDVVSSQV